MLAYFAYDAHASIGHTGQQLATFLYYYGLSRRTAQGLCLRSAAEYMSGAWKNISLDRSLSGSARALLEARRTGFRNGNWGRLSLVDRGLYRCALWVAKVHGRIKSLKLLVRVLGIVLRLLEKRGIHIWRAGQARAQELMRIYEERNVFRWAPDVRSWLVDRSYVRWLGLNALIPY
jgi:hypothetical protein